MEGVYVVPESEFNQEFKKNYGIKKLPTLKFYAVSNDPEARKHNGVDILFKDAASAYDLIYSEIKEDVTEVSENSLTTFIVNTGLKKQRASVIMFIKSAEEIPIQYKAITRSQELQKYLSFSIMSDPTAQVVEQFQIKKLPHLGGVLIESEEEELQNQYKIFIFSGEASYQELYNFLSSVS